MCVTKWCSPAQERGVRVAHVGEFFRDGFEGASRVGKWGFCGVAVR